MSIIDVIPYIDIIYLIVSGAILDTILTSELKSRVSWGLAGFGIIIVMAMIFLMGTHVGKPQPRVVVVEQSILF